MGDWSDAMEDGVICRGCALPLEVPSADGLCSSCRQPAQRHPTAAEVDAYITYLSDAVSRWRKEKQEAFERYRELLAKAQTFGANIPDYLSFQLETCLRYEVECKRCLTFLESCYTQTRRDFGR